MVATNISAAGVVTVPSTTGLAVGMSVSSQNTTGTLNIPVGFVITSIINGTPINVAMPSPVPRSPRPLRSAMRLKFSAPLQNQYA